MALPPSRVSTAPTSLAWPPGAPPRRKAGPYGPSKISSLSPAGSVPKCWWNQSPRMGAALIMPTGS